MTTPKPKPPARLIEHGSNDSESGRRVRRAQLVLVRTDGRALISRRLKGLTRQICKETDPGGEDALTEVKRQLIKRFAATCVLAEALEAKLARDQHIDIGEHALLTSTLIRLANVLGAERVAKVVNPPDLQQYLRQRPRSRPTTIDVEAE
jgi:hypothetical protein